MVCLHRLPVKAHPRKSAEKILISIFTTSWAQRRALQLPFNSPFPLRPRSLAPPGHLKSRWLKSLALPTTDPPVVAYNTMKDWRDVLPTLIGEPLQVPIKFIWLIKGSRCAYVVQRACVVSGIFENMYLITSLIFYSFRYTLCDFVPTTITEMGHTQPSWKIDSSADITGNKVKAVDTGKSTGWFYPSFSWFKSVYFLGTDCSNDYVEIREYTFSTYFLKIDWIMLGLLFHSWRSQSMYPRPT